MAKVTYRLDIDFDGIPRGERVEAKNEIGEAVISAILDDLGGAVSPVTGGRFRRLSKSYAAVKRDESSSVIPNMELSGDMLDSLTFRRVEGGIEIGFFQAKQAEKAAGHNHFTGFPKSTLPVRKSIPDEAKKERFRPGIRDLVEGILRDFKDSDDDDD